MLIPGLTENAAGFRIGFTATGKQKKVLVTLVCTEHCSSWNSARIALQSVWSACGISNLGKPQTLSSYLLVQPIIVHDSLFL